MLGAALGFKLRTELGSELGLTEGEVVGSSLGEELGSTDGELLGILLGAQLGYKLRTELCQMRLSSSCSNV